jgi:hypothetical protein
LDYPTGYPVCKVFGAAEVPSVQHGVPAGTT